MVIILSPGVRKFGRTSVSGGRLSWPGSPRSAKTTVGAPGPDAIVSWRSSPANAFESDVGIIAHGFAFILDGLFADRFESP